MTQTHTPEIEAYWQSFVETVPSVSSLATQPYTAEGWGDSAALADELGSLIVDGTKTATCSALWEWQAEGESLPAVGARTVVLDGRGQPLCIVETIEVTIRRYDEIDAQFASDEGEGDRSLRYWRDAHWRFFTRTLAAIGKQPTFEMPLVCERFRVVFPI